MELNAYIKSLADDEARVAFAARCETSLGHLRNVSYGKKCSAELASAIDRQSGGKVPRWVLRPDDWHEVWPELKRRRGAPKMLERQEVAA